MWFGLFDVPVEQPWFVSKKSSIAEVPLNLTWNIDAFSGSFTPRPWFSQARFFRGAAFRMTG